MSAPKGLVLSSSLTRVLAKEVRIASRVMERDISMTEFLSKVLEDGRSLCDVQQSYFERSPKGRAAVSAAIARRRKRTIEARAFLLAKERRFRKEGRPRPMKDAAEALAKRLHRPANLLPSEMCPPTWMRPRPSGWWAIPAKGGRLPSEGPYWPGYRTVSVADAINYGKGREEREAKAFAADVTLERDRLEAIAHAKGIALWDHCAEHGEWLYECESCSMPAKPAFLGAHSYWFALRGEIVGKDVWQYTTKPTVELLRQRLTRKGASKKAA